MQGHGAAAVGAEADAGKEGGTADHAGRGDFWIAGVEPVAAREAVRLALAFLVWDGDIVLGLAGG